MTRPAVFCYDSFNWNLCAKALQNRCRCGTPHSRALRTGKAPGSLQKEVDFFHMDIWPSIVLIFMLIFVNAFFAMSEIAIISINSQKMKLSLIHI